MSLLRFLFLTAPADAISLVILCFLLALAFVEEKEAGEEGSRAKWKLQRARDGSDINITCGPDWKCSWYGQHPAFVDSWQQRSHKPACCCEKSWIEANRVKLKHTAKIFNYRDQHNVGSYPSYYTQYIFDNQETLHQEAKATVFGSSLSLDRIPYHNPRSDLCRWKWSIQPVWGPSIRSAVILWLSTQHTSSSSPRSFQLT